ncbi:MAG: polysaccharide deacetylase [Ruminococcaceae bacterium]|nr:polysaccharide deacetylase [Oscillospiraceae bacterium]
MFQGKNKAVTFSYDDGVTQDVRLVELLNRYNLKATFNLNSELLGKEGSLLGGKLRHNKNLRKDVPYIYAGHEVAAHTLTHPFLPDCSEGEIIRQVEQDRLNLSELVGYEVVGMAYPCGGENNNDRVAKVIQEHTGIQYARTITSTFSFAPQKNLYRFNPTVYHVMEPEQLFALGEKFVKMDAQTPQIFYIWGHSYELDIEDNWAKLEDFFRLISNREDIFYGTNKEVLL